MRSTGETGLLAQRPPRLVPFSLGFTVCPCSVQSPVATGMANSLLVAYIPLLRTRRQPGSRLQKSWRLEKAIGDQTAKIGVVGLGYVASTSCASLQAAYPSAGLQPSCTSPITSPCGTEAHDRFARVATSCAGPDRHRPRWWRQPSTFWSQATSIHRPCLRPTSRITPTCSKPQERCRARLPGLGRATAATTRWIPLPARRASRSS